MPSSEIRIGSFALQSEKLADRCRTRTAESVQNRCMDGQSLSRIAEGATAPESVSMLFSIFCRMSPHAMWRHRPVSIALRRPVTFFCAAPYPVPLRTATTWPCQLILISGILGRKPIHHIESESAAAIQDDDARRKVPRTRKDRYSSTFCGKCVGRLGLEARHCQRARKPRGQRE